MKFSGREDILAPADRIFDHLTDFETHERAALRRGIVTQRVDGLSEIGPGVTWSARVKFRGKTRNVTLELMECSPPEALRYRLDGSGLEGTFDIELLALSHRKSRMNVGLEVRPRNLTGRLLMQSLRILKPTLNKRFKARLAIISKGIEDIAGPSV